MYRTRHRSAGLAYLGWICVVALSLPGLGTLLRAQSPRIPHKLSVAEKKATRSVRFLELPHRRRQATTNLLKMGKDAVSALTRGLDHPDDEIVIVCIRVLREFGPIAKAALPRLNALADGKNRRIATAARWARARLQIVGGGVTLIADYGGAKIREFDAKGKETYSHGKLASLWDVERLANGNYLATLYTGSKVVEITPAGKEVWSFAKLRSPLDADRLATGNTLIADTQANRVIEVDPRGKIVWKYESTKQPYDADRLPSGNTLISEFGANRVIEVNPEGKIVWTVKVAGAMGADRLANGNTLITSYSRGVVLEVDARGGIVDKLDGLTNPNEARRLPNGHTLVAERGMIREFGAGGKEVARIVCGRAGTVHRY